MTEASIDPSVIAVPRPSPDDISAICVLDVAGGELVYSASWRDIDADTAFAVRIFDLLDVRVADTVHLIGAGARWPLIWPLERALIDRGAAFSAAEPVGYDATRTEMFVRRLHPKVVFGISGEITSALLGLEFDLAAVFGGATASVVVDDTAASALAAAGLGSWRLRMLGPVLSLEPPAAGLDTQSGLAIYDETEWRIDEEAGELLVSSVAPRATPLSRFKSGLRGHVAKTGDQRQIRFSL